MKIEENIWKKTKTLRIIELHTGTASKINEMAKSKNVFVALFFEQYSNDWQMSTMAVKPAVRDSSLRKTAPWFREFQDHGLNIRVSGCTHQIQEYTSRQIPQKEAYGDLVVIGILFGNIWWSGL